MRYKTLFAGACLVAMACAMELLVPLRAAKAQDASFMERTIAVHGMERSYFVHIPRNVSRPAPLVLVLHGGGGRPEAIAGRTGINALADQYGFIAVYPAGAARQDGRGTWNVGGPYSRSSANDVGFVQALLGDIERAMPIDHARIYAVGLSMGGVFAYRLACEMSNTFAAIAAVSATMTEPACHPHSPVAILHIHGTNDERIPINGGMGPQTALSRSWPAPQQGVSLWGRFDGCRGEPARGPDGCITYGQCRATVEFCMVPGAQHGWLEGSSTRIWDFFAANPKR